MTKRPGTMSDDERATIGRRRQQAAPAFVETELTPPPQEPPRPETLPGYDTIPPPIRQQLDLLADGIGAITTALGKVWDARKDGERLDRIDGKLGSLAEAWSRHEAVLETFVVPAVKDGMKATDGVALQLSRLVPQLEALTLNVSQLSSHLRTFELEVRTSTERQQSKHDATDVRLAATERRIDDHEVRIDDIERTQRDKDVVSKALAKRQKRATGGLAGAVAAVVAGIVAAITQVLK